MTSIFTQRLLEFDRPALSPRLTVPVAEEEIQRLAYKEDPVRTAMDSIDEAGDAD